MAKLALVQVVICCLAVMLASGVLSYTKDVEELDGDIINNKAVCPPSCPSDCRDIQGEGHYLDGRYVVYLASDNYRPLLVYCDMQTTGGGWLVFQRRFNGLLDFYRDWDEYEDGFGESTGEFWLGNYDLHFLLAQKQYNLRIDLLDFGGNRAFEEYQFFTIGSNISKYNMNTRCGAFGGPAGDSLTYHSNMRFTTYDNDNDLNTDDNVATMSGGAWWYFSNYQSNLNAVYNTTHFRWNTWNFAPLRTTEMKFRPM